MNSSERIVFNSVVLYVKLVITICVNLIATRLILNAMGVTDYGVVNLISGIVSMLSFMQSAMALSTSRYMSVNFGKGDIAIQKKIFNSGLFLHLLFGLFIILLLEACVPLVFNSKIQIPVDRYTSSMILYQLTCVGTFLVFICVPVDATLNAHENMLWVSYASILESLIRLAGAYWLLYYQKDKLIFYGLLIVVIRLSSLLLKYLYSKKKYVEVKIQKKDINIKLIREMFNFSLWNMFGALSLAVRGQGVAIILNIFNGVIVNTAYGIGQQVSGQLSTFSGTISKSMSPQIMQREGRGARKSMVSLVYKQCRYTTLFLFMFALPLYVEMPYVLQIWLKTVPEYAVDFCRVFLLIALFGQMSSGLMTAIQAKGKIVAYQLTMSFLILMNIPIAYILQKNGFPPAIVLWAMLIIEIICLAARLFAAKILVGITLLEYVREVLIKLVVIVLPTTTTVLLCKHYIATSCPAFGQLLLYVFITIVFIAFISYLSFDRGEKELVISLCHKCKKTANES